MTAAARTPAAARNEVVYSLGAMAAVAVIAWTVAWALDSASYDVVVGCLIGGVLAVVSVLVGRALARREPDPRIARLLIAAPLLKLSMTVVRYAVAFVVYDGSADAAVYHHEGVRLRAFYAQGIFDADLGRPFIGTGFVRALTGLLYTGTGPSLLGAFFVFSWLGFWGLFLFYRAFCIAVPDADRFRYAVLVLLLPSLLFWPSSLGKEAWMTLGLGVFAYGSARILTSRVFGFTIAAAGLLATGAIRPHVAAMAAVALVTAYFTRRAPEGASLVAPIRKLVGLLVLGLLLVVAVTQTRTLLGIDRFNTDAVNSARSEVLGRTAVGQSAFENEETDFDITEFPNAVVSVLFRPFPWEARNLQALIASIEGVLLLCLVVGGWRRLQTGIRSVLRTPYIVLCTTYSVLFIYGFSSFANFGILTRQRVQVLPFVLVLVCLSPYRRASEDRWALLRGDTPTSEPERDGSGWPEAGSIRGSP